jgi:UPF0755 protein
MRRILISLSVLIVLGIVGGGTLLWRAKVWLDTPITALERPMSVDIERGATLRAVATDLESRGVVNEPQIWVTWARLTRRANTLKAGEYELQPGLTPRALLELLSSGQVVLHAITFIEGNTFSDMRRVLAANPEIRGEYAQKSDGDIMRALGEADTHPEGQFFPDTYRFARGTTDLDILTMAHRRMQTELAAAWGQRASDLPLAGPYEALILASIVEKETALDRERPLVAGVFVERLRRGMRLQTDPTVIYGMAGTYDGDIRRADLRRDTPYNTYTRAGLPPTPIAMPGLDSLRAAAQPQLSGALFFVATGEGDGSHHFSTTLAEHEVAVKSYLRKLRTRR